jgi:hypothetical protein
MTPALTAAWCAHQASGGVGGGVLALTRWATRHQVPALSPWVMTVPGVAWRACRRGLPQHWLIVALQACLLDAAAAPPGMLACQFLPCIREAVFTAFLGIVGYDVPLACVCLVVQCAH